MTRYKGFSILARPYAIHGSGWWTADLEVRRAGRIQPFTLGGRYRSEGEAQVECAEMGRRIIDGGIAGWSVDNLRGLQRTRSTFADIWQQQSNFVFLCVSLLVLALGVFAFLRLART